MDNLTPPLVTVGIPFFNAEKYLFNSVKSTLNQTYTNLEILLIDDGSTDGSLKIVKKFEQNDKRVTVISDGENFGLPKRLNQLSDLAKGRFYARMDADDIMFPDRIKTQVEYLLNNPEVDLLGTGLIAIDNNNEIIGLRKGTALNKITFKVALQGPWAAHPTITGKSNWFKKNKYNENLKRAQDFELWVRTVEESNFTSIKEPLLFYREASTSSMIKRLKSSRYSIITYWKYLNKTGLIYTLKRTTFSLIKVFMYFCFFLFGFTSVLITKRSFKLSNRDKIWYKKILIDTQQ
ncbi:glycosyltransferase family 2 protein [Tamlana sp. s12]|uniref:glycosyltransferase family 2 protein n=1 Tax=Tamlana sp. s12 TaxID=1630406 RepID=UPI0007FFFB0A|nr:glycosyltransferase family 2 protein [Tamlana sp. s12]OBQ54105.1 hypothetical protein VQ01_11655 [Tamlana sp. s12]QQY81384.1 glycosyltransferase family 2 protein [Tamlana sp. s12]